VQPASAAGTAPLAAPPVHAAPLATAPLAAATARFDADAAPPAADAAPPAADAAPLADAVALLADPVAPLADPVAPSASGGATASASGATASASAVAPPAADAAAPPAAPAAPLGMPAAPVRPVATAVVPNGAPDAPLADPTAAQPALIGAAPGVHSRAAPELAHSPLSEAEGEQAPTKEDGDQMQTDNEDDGIAAAKAKRALQAQPPGSQVPPMKRKAVEKAQSDATDSEAELSDFSAVMYGADNDPTPPRAQRPRNQGRAVNKKRGRGGKR